MPPRIESTQIKATIEHNIHEQGAHLGQMLQHGCEGRHGSILLHNVKEPIDKGLVCWALNVQHFR